MNVGVNMTNEIKKLIRQIQCGEVPKGYKTTKIGTVPKEWQEIRFKKMFSRLNRRNGQGNTNVLTISALHGLICQEDFFNKTVASDDKSNYFLLYKGEFAYNKSYSNGYSYGALKRLVLYDYGIVSPLYICFSPTAKNECPDFYVQYFEAGLMNREIKAFAQEGARNHGLLNISVDDFFNSYLLFPPLSEQQRIAEILSTQDKTIALKEKLLAEKQAQKKYLMQQLLTGKKRLNESSRKWNYTSLKKAATPITEKVGTRDLEVLSISSNIGFVNQAEKFGRKIAGAQYSNYTVIQRGDFSYNKGNSKSYPQGCLYLLDNIEIAAVPNVFISFRLNESCYAPYYKYLFESGYLNRQLFRLINFGVRNDGLLNLSDNDFYRCTIPIPPLNEQREIANIMYTASHEIDLLKKDVEQEKQKKRALMQLLLTGIVRVKA